MFNVLFYFILFQNPSSEELGSVGGGGALTRTSSGSTATEGGGRDRNSQGSSGDGTQHSISGSPSRTTGFLGRVKDFPRNGFGFSNNSNENGSQGGSGGGSRRRRPSRSSAEGDQLDSISSCRQGNS